MVSVSSVPAMETTSTAAVSATAVSHHDDLVYPRSRVHPLLLTEYTHWFVNRRDFYIQHPYLLPADRKEDAPIAPCMRVSAPLTEDHVLRHIVGQHTIGLYAMESEFNSCKWFALDGDYSKAEMGSDAKEDLEKIAAAMKEDGLFPAMEASRRGAHLWILCAEPLPALLGRIYLYSLLDRLGYDIRGVRGNVDGIEIFPKQESLKQGQYGNGLRGPFGIHRKSMKRYWFVDAEPNLEAQFAYLRKLPRLTRAKLEDLTAGYTMPEDLIPKPAEPWDGSRSDSAKFDFRGFLVEPARKASIKNDFFIQCPCCAAGGRDNGKNNLHVTPLLVDEQGKGPPGLKNGPPDLYCFACHSSYKDLWEAFCKLKGRPQKQSTAASRKFE